jgi:hypothetical protein
VFTIGTVFSILDTAKADGTLAELMATIAVIAILARTLLPDQGGPG